MRACAATGPRKAAFDSAGAVRGAGPRSIRGAGDRRPHGGRGRRRALCARQACQRPAAAAERALLPARGGHFGGRDRPGGVPLRAGVDLSPRSLAVRPPALVRAGSGLGRPVQRQSALPPPPPARLGVGQGTRHRLVADDLRASATPSGACVERLPLVGLRRQSRHSRRRRQRRVRDDVLRRRRTRTQFRESRNSSTRTPSPGSTAPSPNISASRCWTANTK